MKGVIFFAILASCRGLSEDWNSFKVLFGKTYSSADEENVRMRIFEENMLKIKEHNKKYDEGLTTYEMGMNRFGDMTAEEVRELLLRLNNTSFPSSIPTYSYIPPATQKELPDTVDWREKGAVTPVKNQAECGSCWAFSATGALEGQHFRKTGKLISLSEQQLVDCSGAYGNYGCNGGMPDRAYNYIINNKAIATEADYPYEGWDGACRFARASGVVVTGIMEVEQDETTLQKAVATVGPISICIHATNNFMFYKKGIFEDNTCSSTVINHAVLAVGYGRDSGHDYWLVKNSWGTDWGENGYIKMARNRDNQCAVALIARYPLV